MITARSAHCPRGFSFVEILFAIAILGVGFIMIAGVFPVAIQQTKLTQEEATAQVVETNANALMSGAFVSGVPTGTTAWTGGWNWDRNVFQMDIDASRITASDPRYAWIPLYQYYGGSPRTLQFVPIVVQARNTQTFDPVPGDTDSAQMKQRYENVLKSLVPVPCKLTVTNGGTQIEFKEFFWDGSSEDEAGKAVVEGAVIALRSGSTKIVRLGLKVSDKVWNLEAGSTFGKDIGTASAPVEAWLIGRGLADPTKEFDATDNPFEGPLMVIGVGSVKGLTY